MNQAAVSGWTDYELLDSGNGRKLERFGGTVLSRPAPQALWPEQAAPHVWSKASGIYIRSNTGGGHWNFCKPVPESWPVSWRKLRIKVKPTGFGHLGVFPEQVFFWDWLEKKLSHVRFQVNILNLFAYTGYSSLVSARMGAAVTHVDGAKSAVTWARENAEENGLKQQPIRWIADDVSKFVTREKRRGVKYDAVIMDPPTFGRGPKGEVWKIEQDLLPLLKTVKSILSDQFQFLLFTCHSQHVSSPGIANLFDWMFKDRRQDVRCSTGDIIIPASQAGSSLPAGLFGLVNSNI
jgi:23S rRNA (cytosine1962-C5)-methyltransferase